VKALRVAPDKVGRGDPRYGFLIRRDFNKRFAGNPDYVHLVGSTEDVVDAVQEAMRSNLRLAVRSGGHCLEGFVADDLADPELNTSGIPWHTLYYKDNYPRLQRIKSHWDSLNVFHHALSVRPLAEAVRPATPTFTPGGASNVRGRGP